MKKLLKLDSFWLRIVALLTMTIDHVGVFLSFREFYVLRIIGRLALPLFIFLTVQGALKTSNKKRYIFRVGIFAIFVSLALAVCQILGGFYLNIAYSSGNIFLDLLLIILCVTILESENKKIKPLIILPIAYSILSYVILRLEGCDCNGYFAWFLPSFRLQYGFYSLMLGFGFYFAIKWAPVYVEKYYPSLEDHELEQVVCNILSVGVLVFATLFLFVCNTLFGTAYEGVLDGIQAYAIFAGIFILFYNGKRGYNAKWFKVAYYLYYPLHIGIIALIFFIGALL